MDPRLQLRVQRYGWDKAEPHYERFWAAQLEPAQERLLTLAALQPGEQVLDVAAGTGLVTFPAAEAVGPPGRVTATDLSEAMVEALRTGAAARGLANVTALRMDGEALDFASGSFDAALCALGLMYFPDPSRSLAPSAACSGPAAGRSPRCGEPGATAVGPTSFPIVEARWRRRCARSSSNSAPVTPSRPASSRGLPGSRGRAADHRAAVRLGG
ncbi:MAG: class I SAM-dependent methyltransferase [Gemmatimonadales bacterium]